MNLDAVQEIAKAILYEGYMLYPYRPSSVKNQQRWNFGVLFPASYCEAHPESESSFLQSECLLRTGPSTRLTVRLGFLQVVQKLVAQGSAREGRYDFVDRLEVNGRSYQPWQEAIERVFDHVDLDPAMLQYGMSRDFECHGDECIEELVNSDNEVVGALVRRWKRLQGTLRIQTVQCRNDTLKLSVRVENRTESEPAFLNHETTRDEGLLSALVSAHLIIGVENGEFLSLLDPPPGYEELAAECVNRGVWPVLAGEGTSTMLASPIILYDHPQIAGESPGNLFDATEIDEILSLRILTLTDEEKREMRDSDQRARGLLERTENIPHEQFAKLHGVLRGLTPLEETRNE